MYKLSICIPTYNRAKYLPILIDSILRQITPEVEIVISDNASEDNTPELIKNYQLIHKNITYLRLPKNLGADRNYLNVIKIASGNYCWLCGSDDMLETGSISLIIELLNLEPSIILGDRYDCDRNLIPSGYNPMLKHGKKVDIYECDKLQELHRYLSDCKRLGSVFSYLSSIIVKKSDWDEIIVEEKLIGSAYIHAFILLKLLSLGKTLLYLRYPIVYARGDNDSFMAEGRIKRFWLDIKGYRQLGENIFLNDLVSMKKLYSILQYQELSLMELSCIFCLPISGNELKGIYTDLRAINYPTWKINLAWYISNIQLLAKVLRKVRYMPRNTQSYFRLKFLQRKIKNEYLKGDAPHPINHF